MRLFLSSRSIRCAPQSTRLPARSLWPALTRRCLSVDFQSSHQRKVSKDASKPSSKSPPDPASESTTLSDQVRQAMRKIPHPLMVITPCNAFDEQESSTSSEQDSSASSKRGLSASSERGSPSSSEQVPSASELDSSVSSAGLLVSSFNTVTLTPHPIVSFNIKLPSATYTQISRTNHFQASAIWNESVARAFAGGSHAGDSDIAQQPSASDRSLLDVITSALGPTNTLPSARLFALRCAWLRDKSITVGDHVIMVGEVVEIVPPQPGLERFQTLVYVEGEYCIASLPLRVLMKERLERDL